MRRISLLWIVFICLAVLLVYLFSQHRLENLLFRHHRGDERSYADVSVMPWRSVVRLRTAEGRCSGTVIAPEWVVTAAHCVADARTSNGLVARGSMFVLSEYLNGGAVPVARVEDIIVERDYLRKFGRGLDIEAAQLRRDWALLRIFPALDLGDYAVPHVLFLRPPYDVRQGGYGRDSSKGLRKDEGCRVFEHIDYGDIFLLRHNCLISGGDSGGPLFIERDGDWLLVGINVALKDVGGRLGGYAVSLDSVLDVLKK